MCASGRLFLARYGHLRDLHSFPTRRSSDLGGARLAPQGLDARGEVVRRARIRRLLAATERAARDERSEEHTSELQSLRHLVCRLLLEKKKKTNQCTKTNRTTKQTP